MTVASLSILPGSEIFYRNFVLRRRLDRQIAVEMGNFSEVGVTMPHAIAIVDRFYRDI